MANNSFEKFLKKSKYAKKVIMTDTSLYLNSKAEKATEEAFRDALITNIIPEYSSTSFQHSASNSIKAKIYCSFLNNDHSVQSTITEFRYIDSCLYFNLTTHLNKFINENKNLKEHIKDHKTFYEICNDYFKYCILKDINKNKLFPYLCGWEVRTNSELKYEFCAPTNALIFLQGYYETANDIKISKEQIQHLIDFFSNYDIIWQIFSYTLYALSYRIIFNKRITDRTDIANSVFSICIQHSDSKTANLFSNLFCSVFHQKNTSLYQKCQTPRISITSLNFEVPYLKFFCDVPLIIHSKTNQITARNNKVKGIHKLRTNHEAHFYPVYLSNKPMVADEIVNINISNYHIGNTLKNELTSIKQLIDQVLGKYVEYLRNLRSSDFTSKYNAQLSIANSNTIKDFNSIEITDDYYNFRINHLLSSINLFWEFLNNDFQYDDEENHKISVDSIKKLVSTENEVTTQDLLSGFKSYMQSLTKENQNNNDTVFKLSFDNHQQCNCIYFLDCNWLQQITKMMNNNANSLPISEDDILKQLKSNDLLLLRKNRAGYKINRTFDKVKYDCFAINLDKLDQL